MIMKKIFAIMAAAAALFSFASCDMIEDGFMDNDNSPATKVAPSKAAENGFENQVPEGTDVWDVEWDFEGTYWEVEFKTGTRPFGKEYTMYFDLEGNWLATKTEVLIKDVPQYIVDAFKASEYGTTRLDDEEADYYETPGGKFYRFEIEIKGRDAEIDVDLDGNVKFAGYDN